MSEIQHTLTSVDQFLIDLRKSPNAFFKNLQFTEELEIVDKKLNYLKFEDCIFEESLLISGNLGSGATFRCCIIKKTITIQAVQAKYKYKSPFGISSNLTFDNCKIKTLEILESTLERGIQILNDSEIGHFIVRDLSIQTNSDLKIDNSKILYQFDLTYLRVKGNIDIRNSNIISFTRLEDIYAKSFVLQKNKLCKLYIWGSSFSQGLSIDKTHFSDILEFSATNFKNYFGLYDSTFDKEVIVNNEDKINELTSNIDHYFIKNCNFESGFHALYNRSDVHPDLSLFFTNSLKGNMIFEHISFRDVNISGHNNSLSLTFDTCSFNKLLLENVTNTQTIRFGKCKANNELEVPSSFIVDKSNIGKANLLDFDFKSFQKISISDSFISDIQFASVLWFTKDQLINSDIQNRETYRQLKFAAEKSGDNITALEFKSNELYYFQKILTSSTPNYKGSLVTEKYHLNKILYFPQKFLNFLIIILKYFISRDKSKYELDNKLILWLGRTTNSFGTNWTKPLFLIFIITLFFYIGMSISLSEKILWSFDITNVSETISEIGAFPSLGFQLLNPTHELNRILASPQFSTINPKNIGWSVFAFDLIHRIIYAFLLFQLIVAFRKFTK